MTKLSRTFNINAKSQNYDSFAFGTTTISRNIKCRACCKLNQFEGIEFMHQIFGELKVVN